MSRASAYVLACLLTLCGLVSTPSAYSATTVDTSLTFRVTPSSPQIDSKVTMTGQLLPAIAGGAIRLQQRQTSGSWKTVKQVTTETDGRFAATVKVISLGVARYRARLVGTESATSPTRAITVVAKPSESDSFTSVLPTVSGLPRVGNALTVTVGTWTPNPSKFFYQWRRDGAKISGATGTSYGLTAADQGTYVTVEVRATRNGVSTLRESITETQVGDGTFVSSTPTISGNPVVGSVLTVDPGTWSPTPGYAYQWTRNDAPIDGATSQTYGVQPSDAATEIRVSATASLPGYTSMTVQSAPTSVPELEPEPTDPVTFGDVIQPESTTVLPASEATVTFSAAPPDWIAHNTFVRWDTPGAFAHSLDPVPYGTLNAAANPGGVPRPTVGGEYHLNNSLYKYADVSFTVTGRKFAIRYWTYGVSDAMVWIDGHPAAADPFVGSDPGGKGAWNWLIVSRDSDAPATVRLAGPITFSGVDYDASDSVTVTATDRFTLGVVSDSMFETVPYDPRPATNGPGQTLSTLTGFRVWNMAEGGTGYINDGTGAALSGDSGYPGHKASAFGSARRIASIASAPIDALLVNGSLNDRLWTTSAHRAAMDAFLNDVAEVRPDLPIILVSLEPLSFFGVRDQEYAHYRALNANFAPVAAAHSNVVGLIDPYTADWITGTGSTDNQMHDGNQDQYVGSDGIHLNSAGQAYYQGRITDELRPMSLHVRQQ